MGTCSVMAEGDEETLGQSSKPELGKATGSVAIRFSKHFQEFFDILRANCLACSHRARELEVFCLALTG